MSKRINVHKVLSKVMHQRRLRGDRNFALFTLKHTGVNQLEMYYSERTKIAAFIAMAEEGNDIVTLVADCPDPVRLWKLVKNNIGKDGPMVMFDNKRVIPNSEHCRRQTFSSCNFKPGEVAFTEVILIPLKILQQGWH